MSNMNYRQYCGQECCTSKLENDSAIDNRVGHLAKIRTHSKPQKTHKDTDSILHFSILSYEGGLAYNSK